MVKSVVAIQHSASVTNAKLSSTGPGFDSQSMQLYYAWKIFGVIHNAMYYLRSDFILKIPSGFSFPGFY